MNRGIKLALGLGVVGAFAVVLAKPKKASALPGGATVPLPSPSLPGSAPSEATQAQLGEQAKKASAAAVKAKDPVEKADRIMEAVAKAISSGDPAVMRQVAKELAAIGYAHAGELERVAKEIEAEHAPRATPEEAQEVAEELGPNLPIELPAPTPALPVPTPPPVTPPDPQPDTNLAAFNAGRARSEQLTIHLSSVKKGKEDQGRVGSYQEQHGLKKDGKYGPKTALEIASFGVVPVAPFYWPTDWVKAKRDYKAGLLEAGKRYPDLAVAFQAAANKVGG